MPTVDETLDTTYEKMREKLAGVVPEIELRYKAELVFHINRLKERHGAVILGHNYMEPALYHCVPDYVGDSLELCRLAARTDAPIIVFCGVRFMAETAKILNPDKTVLIPSLEAGCSLASSITAADVRQLKTRFPGVPVVSYINTYADVKAESDACCTSSNAAAVIRSFDADAVIFLPDEYLARNVARETGRRMIVPRRGPEGLDDPSGEIDCAMIGWDGRCEVHEKFNVDDIRNIRAQFPEVYVLAHPECSPEVVAEADFSGSTSAMIRAVRESDAPRYLLLTECCMGDNIAAENPGKDMVRLCSVRCPHMNEITLEQTLASLRDMRHVIEVDADIARQARRAIDRMLEVGSSAPACSVG
ncbi:MAG: quinolinate synthase NadA [Phycisphaerae bacterium]